MNCECESNKCDHGEVCTRPQRVPVRTIYGTFRMCMACAINMPTDYLEETQ